MTLTAALGLLKRFWWSIPMAVLFIALLATRSTLKDEKISKAALQASFDQTVAGYRTAAAERKASDYQNLERVKVESAAINERTVDEYTDRIAALRGEFDRRVRAIQARAYPGGDTGAGVPVVSDAAGRTDAQTCDAELSLRERLVASEQAEQLIALQKWVRETAAIDVNGSP